MIYSHVTTLFLYPLFSPLRSSTLQQQEPAAAGFLSEVHTASSSVSQELV